MTGQVYLRIVLQVFLQQQAVLFQAGTKALFHQFINRAGKEEQKNIRQNYQEAAGNGLIH